MGDVKHDWRHQNVVGGAKCDGNEGSKGDTMSAACHNSK